MVIVIVLIVIVVLLALGLWAIFNGLVRRRNRTQEAWSEIDVELKRRHDLIPNLVSTVEGYASHEKSTFEAVTNARAAAVAAGETGDPTKVAAAENALSGTLRSLFAVAENYPQLRAVESFLQLQETLTATEDKIEYARRYYNTSARDYNTALQSFPATSSRARSTSPRSRSTRPTRRTGPSPRCPSQALTARPRRGRRLRPLPRGRRLRPVRPGRRPRPARRALPRRRPREVVPAGPLRRSGRTPSSRARRCAPRWAGACRRGGAATCRGAGAGRRCTWRPSRGSSS